MNIRQLLKEYKVSEITIEILDVYNNKESELFEMYLL